MRGVIRLQLRQRSDKVAILPAQCSSDPNDSVGPISAQLREFYAPSARSGQCRPIIVSDESEVETDIITPFARSSQYRSTTVYDESEVETDIITPSVPSAHPRQYRLAIVSDELVESSDAPDTPRASVNHTGLPLDVAERYRPERKEGVMFIDPDFGLVRDCC
ncbi:hypothetical protein E4U17_004905 [Claviceps sp. LM77 group G4]|nr:hypothetical protein E4U17_004905 [Claviceps sp. LM77 group G4]KAG6056911.1 hypothetical protein E4U33_007589 [Claviceps sp. LM78 group G4]KAG6076641.1 hypothetical protein E4U16_002668 [Claviceps sp. LM84 group G4]